MPLNTWQTNTDDQPIDPLDVVALLEDAPQGTTILATWLKQSQSKVLATCTQMVKDRTITRLPHPDRRWALTTYQPTDAELTRIAKVQPSVHAHAPLRQLQKPDTIKLDGSSASWWVNTPAAGFTKAAEAQQPRMAKAKLARWVDGQVRD